MNESVKFLSLCGVFVVVTMLLLLSIKLIDTDRYTKSENFIKKCFYVMRDVKGFSPYTRIAKCEELEKDIYD